MEPTPLEIFEMTEQELLKLLDRRATRVNRPMSTFKQNSLYPPGGILIEFDPQRKTGAMSFYGLLGSEVPDRIFDKSGKSLHHTTGYNMYCEENIPRSRSVLKEPSEWNELAAQCMTVISSAISDHHGIRYSVSTENNWTTFHVCDYITMLAVSEQNIGTDILIIQPHFLPYQTNGVKDDFPEHIKQFIRLNMDYFFLTFAIWDNHSELPIMIRPPKDIMPISLGIMNNADFVQMQKFKHDALRFRFWSEKRNNLYQSLLLIRNVPQQTKSKDMGVTKNRENDEVSNKESGESAKVASSDGDKSGDGLLSNISSNDGECFDIIKDGAQCFICLEEGGDDLRRDCSCRGDYYGYAHLSCMIAYARSECCNIGHRSDPNERFQKLRGTWKVCGNCRQRYQDQLHIDMANGFDAFVKDAYTNPENPDYWFCQEYPINVMLLIVASEKMEAYHGAEGEFDIVRNLAEEILVSLVGLKQDTSIMKEDCILLTQLEAQAHCVLGDILAQGGDPRKQSHWEKAAALLRSPILSQTNGCGSMIAKIEHKLALLTLCIKTQTTGRYIGNEETVAERRFVMEKLRLEYQLSKKEHGVHDIRTMESELKLAYNIRTFERSTEAERMLIELYKKSRLVLGKDHNFTKRAQHRLQVVTTRLVRLVAGVPGDLTITAQVCQAMHYQDDRMTHCAVRQNPFQDSDCKDPLSFNDMENYFRSLQESGDSHSKDKADFFVINSKALVYVDGTVVICRGIANSCGLNENIGVVTEVDLVNRTYKVRFEDDSLGEKTVHHDDTYILFDMEAKFGNKAH